MTVLVDELTEALRDSLMANRRLRQENKALIDAANDPIALVGMACRFPGGVSGPEDLWRLVAGGTDGIARFPADRGWELDGARAPTGLGRGRRRRARAGSSPMLVGSMRRSSGSHRGRRWRPTRSSGCCWRFPGKRWSRPGSTPDRWRAARPGCSPASTSPGYPEPISRADKQLRGHLITGGAPSVISGRVAYTLGLEGPAVSVDTACSSSLVAMHLAAQALRGRRMHARPGRRRHRHGLADAFVGFTPQGGLAADGRCKSFADTADGTGWGEGVGSAGHGAAVGCAA